MALNGVEPGLAGQLCLAIRRSAVLAEIQTPDSRWPTTVNAYHYTLLTNKSLERCCKEASASGV